MKRKNDDGMVQSALRLPAALRDRLKEAGGERGMGEEIRRRLEASFKDERPHRDPETRELLDAISSFAEDVAMYYGNWSKDAFAFKLLKMCVDKLLEHYEPQGTAVPNLADDLAEDLFGPKHSVEDISETFLRFWKQDQAKRAFADTRKG